MLSQGEIDSILNLLEKPEETGEQQGGPSARRARLYDFRRPDRFSKENLRTLRMVHEAFCRGASSVLSSLLRIGVQVHLDAVEQMVYDDYIQQLPPSTLISIVRLDPLPGRALCEINLDIAFDLLDRLLGGPGSDSRPGGGELTDIEFAVFRSLFTQLLSAYKDAWTSITALSPQFDDIVMNPQFVRTALPGDMAVFVLCEIKMGERSGTLTFCLPYTTLEPIAEKLSTQSWFSSSLISAEASGPAEVESQLQRVTLEASVSLGHAKLTFQELMSLEVGDTVKLDTGPGDELVLSVEGRPKYRCLPGLSGRSLGVQVTRPIDEPAP